MPSIASSEYLTEYALRDHRPEPRPWWITTGKNHTHEILLSLPSRWPHCGKKFPRPTATRLCTDTVSPVCFRETVVLMLVARVVYVSVLSSWLLTSCYLLLLVQCCVLCVVGRLFAVGVRLFFCWSSVNNKQ